MKINPNLIPIESGINANGSYVKYADGTMICSNRVQFTKDISSSYEGAYFASTGSIYFASEFISEPVIMITPEQQGSLLSATVTSRTTEYFGSYIWKAQAKTGVTFYVNFIAIGRWKA